MASIGNTHTGSTHSSYFLDIKSTKTGAVKGESASQIGLDLIEVNSFSFEADRPIEAITGASTGRVICKPLRFVVPISIASPVLLDMFFTNENIKTAKLFAWRPGGDGKEAKYLEWIFYECRITSYNIGSDEKLPHDTFQMVYAKADYQYYRLKVVGGGADGNRLASWNGFSPSTA